MEKLSKTKSLNESLSEDEVSTGEDSVEHHWDEARKAEGGIDDQATKEALANDDW
jgi:hypothetical protein